MVLGAVVCLFLPLTVVLLLCNIYVYSLYSGQGSESISPFRWILAIVLPVAIAKWGLHKKNLSESGAVAAFIVGMVMTLSSYCFMASTIAFFTAGSLITKWRSSAKRKLEADFNNGQRNWLQVVCNGGVAAELALIHLVDSGSTEHVIDFQQHYSSSWLAMSVLGAIACSAGDTFSSEVGSVVGTGRPWLITNLQRVPRGTNGGISVVGTLAAILGGLIVGLAYLVTQFFVTNPDVDSSAASAQWPILVVAGMGGLIGSLVDSIFGATLQYSGINKETGCIVESPGEDVERISGYPLLSNHGVNLISSVVLCLFTPQFALIVWGHLV